MGGAWSRDDQKHNYHIVVEDFLARDEDLVLVGQKSYLLSFVDRILLLDCY